MQKDFKFRLIFKQTKEFTILIVEAYVVSDGISNLRLQNWNQSMGNTFAELHYKTRSTLIYLQDLKDNNFDMPINNEADFTGLDIYSAF